MFLNILLNLNNNNSIIFYIIQNSLEIMTSKKLKLSDTNTTWDKNKKIPKKVRCDIPISIQADEVDSIKSFLLDNTDELRLDVSKEKDLTVIRDVETTVGRICRLQPNKGGIPILNSTIVVQIKDNKVKELNISFPADTHVAMPIADKKLKPEEAVKIAVESVSDEEIRMKPGKSEQVYYPTAEGLKLAYLVIVCTKSDPFHDWRFIIDAYDGKILEKEDLIVAINGRGLVFDPNPVVTANDNTFRDPTATNATCGFDGTAQSTIDNEQVRRTLRDIKLENGKHKLDGPYCKIVNINSPNTTIPEEVNANDFEYPSDDERFEAVNVYYHIDTIQRYIQSLGITSAHNKQIEADPHDQGCGSSGCAYFGSDLKLHFGNSGSCKPDRAEDGHVMLHEYGHAIQRDQLGNSASKNPTTNRYEMGAMGEGFGDILATLYFSEHGGGFQKEVFEDWIFAPNGLRRVDGNKTYPGDWISFDVHKNGEIWSASLWNIYRAIGGDSVNQDERIVARDAVLKTLILSHEKISNNASMPDGAEAVMEINEELDDYRGKHLMEMLDSFHDRGLLVCDPNADLYIRDASDDPGFDQYTGSRFWDSPDVWVRNSDDGVTTHQNPEFGQDNWFYARVHNRGTETVSHFVVTFNVKTWAGTQFVYPQDFVPYISAAVGFDLAPGASTIVKAKWPSNLVPPAGTHGCLLVSAYTPTDVSPSGKHVWEHNNLAQKNLTVVDLAPNDTFVLPFQFGNIQIYQLAKYRLEVRRPQQWRMLPVSIVHKDPKVVKAIYNSINEIKIPATKSTTLPKIKSMIRFLDPARIEIFHRGATTLEPVRFTLARDSTMDVGAEPEEFVDISPEFTDEGMDADFVEDKTGMASIAFRPGLLTGLPIALKPRSQIKVGLKIKVPPEAKKGDVIKMDLVQRNSKRQVVGGVSVQVNVK